MIGCLPILCKKFNNVFLRTGSKHNPKLSSSQCTLTDGYQIFTKAFFSLGQLSYVCQLLLYLFDDGLSFETLTVTVSYGDKNPAPDSMGINYQYPTTNFYRTITLICFICSSCLALSCCGLMHFSFLPLFS